MKLYERLSDGLHIGDKLLYERNPSSLRWGPKEVRYDHVRHLLDIAQEPRAVVEKARFKDFVTLVTASRDTIQCIALVARLNSLPHDVMFERAGRDHDHADIVFTLFLLQQRLENLHNLGLQMRFGSEQGQAAPGVPGKTGIW